LEQIYKEHSKQTVETLIDTKRGN